MKGKEIRLNGYKLPDSVKDDMRYVLDKTQLVEEGFGLCTKDNIIKRGKDFVGDSNRIPVNLILRSCNEDEKLLGVYHTHPRHDSQSSAEDIHSCGIFKILCTGGKDDNKIMCDTYKGEQISEREHVGTLYNISEGITKAENPKYQSNFDCINDTFPLYLADRYIKEKVDKDLDDRRSYLSSLREPDTSRPEIVGEARKLVDDTKVRDVFSNVLRKETKRQLMKYYNETEII